MASIPPAQKPNTDPPMYTNICLASFCALALVLSPRTQEPAPRAKVAPPLPYVDLDDKAAFPAAPAATTTPKVNGSAESPPRPTSALPSDTSAPVSLPGGGSFAPSLPQDRVVFGGDAAREIYAAGRSYKAIITREQFSYVPYFGAQAPQNYPLALSLTSVQMGTVRAPLARATLRQNGNTVRVGRGALEERYEFGPDRVEQKFVVDAPFAGDLVITLRADTELQGERDDRGLRFANTLGSVGYTEAVLIDAVGNRLPMRTRLQEGAIKLHADAATVARAAFPITVDPVLTTWTAGTNTTEYYLTPDIAYSHQTRQYLVVWTRVYSATDTDLWAVALTDGGQVVANSFTTLDGSFARWDEGRVAVCGNNYLAVASRVPSGGGQREIWGITRSVFTTATGPQFQISALTGDKFSPDVGGEFDDPRNFCVVWRRDYSATDHDIHYRLVDANGALNGAVRTIDNTAAGDDYRPSIACSTGRGPSRRQVWPVTWHRLVGGQSDIYGARVSWNGTLETPTFAIDAAPADDDYQACPSSITDDIAGNRYWLVAYTTLATGENDIYVRLFLDGPTPVGVALGYLADLEQLTQFARLHPQVRPQVDTDGSRFAIAYRDEVSATDRNAYVSTLLINASSGLSVIDRRVTLTTATADTTWVSLVATRSGGGDTVAYGAAWDLNNVSAPVNGRIEGAIYHGATPGGGFLVRSTRCGGLSITTANGSPVPAPGRTIRFDVSGGAGPSFVTLGRPVSTPACPPLSCTLGTTLDVMIPGARLDLLIPYLPQLVGATVAVQGAAVFTTGGCPNLAQLVTSDTIDVTIR
jgi:hypothetical protein